MKTFKFLTEPNSNDDLLDFIVYLCNFCNWNHDNISSLNLTGVHVVDWGSFFLLNHSWGTNDSTKLKFRFIKLFNYFLDFRFYFRFYF